jgi:D-alanyl-D-alanine dipeptidase
MIQFSEVVQGLIPPEHQKNVHILLEKINKLREAYGKPLRVTSGYRSKAKHLAIYAAKGITDQSKIPMQSNHLKGLAIDVVPVEDPVPHLQDWIMANESLMADIGLWFEDFSATKTWVHAQAVAPKSGKRFFMP